MATSFTPLTKLQGVGPKTAEKLQTLGIDSLENLLRYYPREYDAYEAAVETDQVRIGEKNAVRAFLRKKPSVRRFGTTVLTVAQLEDASGKLQANWFHMPYLRNSLATGKFYVFRGLVIEKNGRRILEHPELYRPEEYEKLAHTYLPVYAVTSGLSNKTFRRIMQKALAVGDKMEESLPEHVLQAYSLLSLPEAIREIHFPTSRDTLLQARHRLVFEEFFFFQLRVAAMRALRQTEKNHFPLKRTDQTDQFLASLPFPLTTAQQRIWQELQKDLSGKTTMHRLLQGDVGSGKTILAFLALLAMAESGYQGVLMAPTEVLAEQHEKALRKILQQQELDAVQVVMLTGSMTAKERKERLQQIQEGSAQIIIGTHAVFQDAVSYASLGLVITDEQHRFGVRQRGRLQEKGESPHVLVMSATPIPRTLAMMLYGDLDISIIDEMPAHRLPIQNCVVDPSYRETAYRFFEKEVAKGHQIYVVCPMISPNEEMACENVEEYSNRLRNRLPSSIRIGILHGQLTSDEKQNTMAAFAAGEIDVLVSTTVIEVGIDVANATVMMVENAERFGLAQLHQLRGRVGRGEAQSYCIFMRGNDRPETKERLNVLDRSNDGFWIAEEDLRLRGPGDVFGVRQSGIAVFQIADIYRDASVLQVADEAAKNLLQDDPELQQPTHHKVRKLVQEQMQDRFDKA